MPGRPVPVLGHTVHPSGVDREAGYLWVRACNKLYEPTGLQGCAEVGRQRPVWLVGVLASHSAGCLLGRPARTSPVHRRHDVVSC
jgi:hypothetical protein